MYQQRMLPQMRKWLIQVKCESMRAIWQLTVQIMHVYVIVPTCSMSARFPSLSNGVGESMQTFNVKTTREARTPFEIQPSILFQLKQMLLWPCL